MYKYIVIILFLLFTTSCNDNSSDSSSSSMEPKQLMPISSVKRLALVIGNGDYQFVPSLSNPVNDAEDVADALRNLNYEVIVLTNASYKAMLNAVQQFAERLAQLGSVGLFYFSGHGLQTGGNNYLVPVDAKIKTEADIKPLSLNANHVLANMNEAHSQVNVMILDACRDNPFENSVIKSISSKGLAQIVAPSGSFISFATAPMQPAWGGKENERNSIYTKHLLAAMKNKPDVPVGDVLIGVRNQVMLETKDADAQQVPWDSSSLKHQFCFGECRIVDKPKIVIPSFPPVKAGKVNFAAIFNPPPLQKLKQGMFEKTVDFKNRVQKYHVDRMQVFDEFLAKFNQTGRYGDKRYQAGVVSLTDYDPDKEIFYFEIKWQAKWMKKFFSDFPYEKENWIKIAPEEAEALWNAGKEKPFFILVNRLDDRSIISHVIVRGKEKSLYVSSFKKNIVRDRLKDGGYGPEMVFIPAGSFKMGDIQGGGDHDEKPVHEVFVRQFAMGKYEVSFAEYDQFAEADGREKPDDQGWGRGNRPVINVSWHDATAYAKWLSQETGETYRLPTEAEWEYAARAGTETKYWWGNTASHEYANYGKDECCEELAEGKDRWKYTSPVGSFAANPFGLYDTVGNVWEWTCSEYFSIYNNDEKKCFTPRVWDLLALRGGSWYGRPRGVRSAHRGRRTVSSGSRKIGFRLIRI